jgi:uncharacterized protein (DUF1330 family)
LSNTIAKFALDFSRQESAGGAGSKPVTVIVGTPPKRVAIQAWDSLEALNKWYNSADYQDALKIGEKYATFRRYAVEGQ